MIVDSISQPFKLDNSTIELHVPSRRKKSLQSYCSVDFDFLALMRFDVTFDVTLRADDSSFSRFPGSLKPGSSICYILFSSEEKYCGALLLFHKIPLKLN